MEMMITVNGQAWKVWFSREDLKWCAAKREEHFARIRTESLQRTIICLVEEIRLAA